MASAKGVWCEQKDYYPKNNAELHCFVVSESSSDVNVIICNMLLQGHCLSTINPVGLNYGSGGGGGSGGGSGGASGGWGGGGSGGGSDGWGGGGSGGASGGSSNRVGGAPNLGSNIPTFPIDQDPYAVPQDRLISTEGCFSCKVSIIEFITRCIFS